MAAHRLRAYGLSCELLPGWDIRIEQREQSEIPVPGSTEPMGGYTHPSSRQARRLCPPVEVTTGPATWNA